MGARAHSRGGAAPARRASGEDAPAARDGRASLRHDQGPDGSNPLPDEDAATGCRRDGIARAGLQSHARHEHLGRPAAHGSNEGIVVADTRPSAVAEPLKTPGIRFRSTSRPKEPPIRKNDRAWPPRRDRGASMLPPGVFTRPRPKADLCTADTTSKYRIIESLALRPASGVWPTRHSPLLHWRIRSGAHCGRRLLANSGKEMQDQALS